MRVIFVNIHTNSLLAKPLAYFLFGRHCSFKHTYFLQYLIRNKIRIAIYLDGASSSFLIRHKSPFFQKVEVYLWAFLNGYNFKSFEILTSFDETHKEDILLEYVSYPPSNSLATFKGIKVVHLNHFMHGSGFLSKMWQPIGVDYFVAEANLAKNSKLFQQQFPWYKHDVLLLPFAPQKRFVSKRNFQERVNKAVATGTTMQYIDETYNTLLNTFYYHPVRQAIMERQEELKDVIDSFIYDYYEGRRIKTRELGKEDSLALKIYKILWNLYYTGKQPSYHKIDMVELYNQYKMAIVAEEACGLPGIGFFEAMRCGCACIGIDDIMYRDLGLIPNIHYISYDGSIEDLQEKIRYFQSHEAELERIARAGLEFVCANLNEESVSAKFLDNIKHLQHKGE